MASTKYIIIAAGEATRWGGYFGTPKHFAVLNGERILDRTIRLLQENGVSQNDIFVVSQNYQIDGIRNVHIRPNYKDNADADKFLSSRHIWNKTGRTVVLYGDVYFSEDSMRRIVDYELTAWTLFCRPTASEITGTEWGECFAVSFYHWDIERGIQKLNQLVYLYKGELLDRIGGWEWARIMSGVPLVRMKKHREKLDVYQVIDDETDDLDYPDDYERLRKVVER